jgi:8-oxo-dGTP diphosphatase
MSDKSFGLAVKAVIRDEEGRSLLVKRSPGSRHYVEQWEWPGGKVDPGEDVTDALHREVEEETGLGIDLTGYAGAPSFAVPRTNLPPIHVVALCFEARLSGGVLRMSDEHTEAQWVAFGDYVGIDLADNVKDFMLRYAEGGGGTP